MYGLLKGPRGPGGHSHSLCSKWLSTFLVGKSQSSLLVFVLLVSSYYSCTAWWGYTNISLKHSKISKAVYSRIVWLFCGKKLWTEWRFTSSMSWCSGAVFEPKAAPESSGLPAKCYWKRHKMTTNGCVVCCCCCFVSLKVRVSCSFVGGFKAFTCLFPGARCVLIHTWITMLFKTFYKSLITMSI